MSMPSEPTNIWLWSASLTPDEREMIIGFGSIVLVLIAWMVTLMIQKMHRARLDDALKRELVERGMSAQEIVGIIEASSASGCRARRAVAKAS
jgi:type II secretory pathway component PulM